MKQSVLVTILVLGLASSAHALEVHPQVFVGSGFTHSMTAGPDSVATTGGIALVVPVSERFFVRGVVGAGAVVPLADSADEFPVLQAGALVGRQINSRFSLLAGVAATVLFTPKETLTLPTGIISLFTQIWGPWGVFAPLSYHERGVGFQLQLGYTW